jgi:hypothetical protein
MLNKKEKTKSIDKPIAPNKQEVFDDTEMPPLLPTFQIKREPEDES